MNDIIIMNQSQTIGISARGRALGFGHALGPGAPGMPKAQGSASSTDANALALIHDDNIILFVGHSKSDHRVSESEFFAVRSVVFKRLKDFSGHSHMWLYFNTLLAHPPFQRCRSLGCEEVPRTLDSSFPETRQIMLDTTADHYIPVEMIKVLYAP